MKQVIQTTHNILAPADQVWPIISRGDQVEAWIPIIANSQLQEGNKRHCDMQDGSPLEETVLKSEHLRTFMYSIDRQEAFPVSSALGTIRLESTPENNTTLYWDLEFELTQPEAFEEFKQSVEQIYAASATKLEALATAPVNA